MKKTTKDAFFTSFHGVAVLATVNELIDVCGQPIFSENSGEDKVNFEWVMETDDGDVFTIYDWKEYRTIGREEVIEWHIGSHSKLIALTAGEELNRALTLSEEDLRGQRAPKEAPQPGQKF